MTDGQDAGWQPQQGNAEQNWRDQPWQENRYDTGTHRQRISAPQSLPNLPEGTNWFQPGSRQQYPSPDPPSQPPYGPPGGPQDRKPWAARHKVLTGFLAFCGLVFIIGTAAAAGFSSSSSSSSGSAAVASSPTVKAPATTASPTVKKPPVATHAVTTAPSAPAPTTPAPPSTQPRTTAAVPKSTPSSPAHTTAAPTPSPTASKPPATCHPLTVAGKCYEPGGFCPKSDHGTSGVAGDGKAIECVDVANVGWRWEAA
jgi:hypothetical protein